MCVRARKCCSARAPRCERGLSSVRPPRPVLPCCRCVPESRPAPPPPPPSVRPVLFWFVMCCQLQIVVMHCFAKSWRFLRGWTTIRSRTHAAASSCWLRVCAFVSMTIQVEVKIQGACVHGGYGDSTVSFVSIVTRSLKEVVARYVWVQGTMVVK